MCNPYASDWLCNSKRRSPKAPGESLDEDSSNLLVRAGIVAEPTEDLHRLQDELIKAFEPYTVKTGTPAAFFSEDGGRVGLSVRRLWHAQGTQGPNPLSAALIKNDRSSQTGGLRRPRSEMHLEPRSSLRASHRRRKTPVLPDGLWRRNPGGHRAPYDSWIAASLRSSR